MGKVEVTGFLHGAKETKNSIDLNAKVIEEREVKRKSKAGRKAAGAKVDIKIKGKSLVIKKIKEKPVKINKSYYLEEEYINIVERRANEIGITPSQLIQEAIKLMDSNLVIEE